MKRSRTGWFDAWRAVAAAPAMLGSLLLVMVLFGWLGEWEALVLLIWLGAGAAMVTKVGERFAVRVGYRFRSPTAAQQQLLASAWAAALHRADLQPDAVDLYVQRSGRPNA